jgi:hypothetical protein
MYIVIGPSSLKIQPWSAQAAKATLISRYEFTNKCYPANSSEEIVRKIIFLGLVPRGVFGLLTAP